MKVRREIHKRKVIKIAGVSAKLFEKKGYLATNMEEISSTAKISKGAIYYYFSKKEDILFFILDVVIDALLGDLEAQLEEIGSSASKVQFVISRHLEIYSKNVAECKVLLYDSHCLPRRKFEVIAEKERKYYRIVSGVLSEFLGGDIQKEKLTAVTFALFGMCNWTYVWYDTRKSLTGEDVANIFGTILMRGIKKVPEMKIAD